MSGRPPPTVDSHTLREEELRYAALAEAEAGILKLDPIDPHAFPVAYPDRPTTTKDDAQNTSTPVPPPPDGDTTTPPRRRSTARRLQRELEARLSHEKMSQLAAIQQNATKENPALTEEIHKQVHMGHEMLAGSASAVVSRLCVAPLDVLKIRFQIQEQASQNRQYTSVMQAFKKG
jgi:hypothetical protein